MLVIALVISALTFRHPRPGGDGARAGTAHRRAVRDEPGPGGDARPRRGGRRWRAGTWRARFARPGADPAAGRGGARRDPGRGERRPSRWTRRSAASRSGSFERGRAAGVGTDTLPAALARYVPLAGSLGVVGVVGVRRGRREALPGPRRSSTCSRPSRAQAALRPGAGAARRAAQREQVEVEAERLRTALLSSLSHDMRTPARGDHRRGEQPPGGRRRRRGAGGATRRDLLKSILDESQRMNRLIGNLLDMIRVEIGALSRSRATGSRSRRSSAWR